MKTKILFVILLGFLSSCKESKILDVDQESQIYSLINDFVLDSLYKVDLISREAMMFVIPKKYEDHPPPPGFYCSNNHVFSNGLVFSKMIDSIDLQSIRKQITQKRQFLWDPSKLKCKTINRDSIVQIFKNNKNLDPWGYLKKRFNVRSFLFLSFPLFSKNNNTILLSVELHCGGLCGESHFYIFKKINGKWTILYSEQGWVSSIKILRPTSMQPQCGVCR